MSDALVDVQNVSIRYRVGDCQAIGLKEYVMRKLTHRYRVEEFCAVKDVSLQIFTGDMLGIVGVNGSGKSTLLKAISGIMRPTEGTIVTRGKIAALLELGSGFDGDLTVKENTFLRGALLGYQRQFIQDAYRDIIEFAGLEEFEDRPFRQLSSGMQARLAFSIASMVQPEILILDEVLSVGDGAFQKKSEQKMRSVIQAGATTILVSHSTAQVREMCTKVLWLDKGNQMMFGDTQMVCDAYEKFLGEL
ncbi:MAG: ABC transporter ATP-binding protein [Agathobaculum sp.]|uniref:ABC transporter ATP-binding protein n=1 Tax=Agathobaculum sp. TaxID=2048138 RepID=UPI0025BD012C|nr:ABC transporter ATP-binding protein [Agathobaculum sp.]MCI7126440.1 ABC transporter ATP-binding protein [Agathobaculum sp.]